MIFFSFFLFVHLSRTMKLCSFGSIEREREGKEKEKDPVIGNDLSPYYFELSTFKRRI